MKKSCLVALCALFISSAVLADYDHCPREKKAAKRMDRLVEKLQLTDEQKQPVIDIITQQRKKARELRRAAYEQMKPRRQALREETRTQIAAILDENQLQKYDEMSEKRKKWKEKRFSRE